MTSNGKGETYPPSLPSLLTKMDNSWIFFRTSCRADVSGPKVMGSDGHGVSETPRGSLLPSEGVFISETLVEVFTGHSSGIIERTDLWSQSLPSVPPIARLAKSLEPGFLPSPTDSLKLYNRPLMAHGQSH